MKTDELSSLDSIQVFFVLYILNRLIGQKLMCKAANECIDEMALYFDLIFVYLINPNPLFFKIKSYSVFYFIFTSKKQKTYVINTLEKEKTVKSSIQRQAALMLR